MCVAHQPLKQGNLKIMNLNKHVVDNYMWIHIHGYKQCHLIICEICDQKTQSFLFIYKQEVTYNQQL